MTRLDWHWPPLSVSTKWTRVAVAAALGSSVALASGVADAQQQTFHLDRLEVPGAPDDGYPSTAVKTKATPAVLMGTAFVPDGAVKYSGLAPGLVGVWQINVEIPKTVITTPNNPTDVVLLQNSVFSGSPATGREVQIYVKQRP